MDKKRYDLALDLATQAVKSSPSDFKTWSILVKVYTKLGDFENALLSLNSCPMNSHKEKYSLKRIIPLRGGNKTYICRPQWTLPWMKFPTCKVMKLPTNKETWTHNWAIYLQQTWNLPLPKRTICSRRLSIKLDRKRCWNIVLKCSLWKKNIARTEISLERAPLRV